MKLHYSPTSPYARKVLVTAAELGLADRIAYVPVNVLMHAPNREMARHNPLMKVPTLERDDGTTLYDSVVICEYLDALADGRVFPREGEARWQALRLHALADGLTDASLLVRYETAFRPEALRWPEWIAAHMLKIDNALDAAEQQVARFPASFDIGQIGLVCALGYLDFRFAHHDWRKTRPALAGWFATVSERDSVKRTVPTA